jgi:hypothetical protein
MILRQREKFLGKKNMKKISRQARDDKRRFSNYDSETSSE